MQLHEELLNQSYKLKDTEDRNKFASYHKSVSETHGYTCIITKLTKEAKGCYIKLYLWTYTEEE